MTFPPLVFVGKISYSLYLWHWPLIVFFGYISTGEAKVVIALTILVCATLSYYFVETPFRRGFRNSWGVIALMPVTAVLCLAPVWVFPMSPGVPTQLSGIDAAGAWERNRAFEATDAIQNGKGGLFVGSVGENPKLVLVGSSHARVFAGAFAAYAEETSEPGLVMATSAIGISAIGQNVYGRDAGEINDIRFSYLESTRPEVVLVAGMWSSEMERIHFEDEFSRRVRRLSRVSQHVIVLLQVPMVRIPSDYDQGFRKYMLASSRDGTRGAAWPSEEVVIANLKVKRFVESLNLRNVRVLDTYTSLLDEAGNVMVSREEKFFYSDHSHLNDAGARWLFEATIRPVLEDLL